MNNKKCKIDTEVKKQIVPVVSTDKRCPPIRNITHPLRYYEFTQDEIKALEECDRESFYRRCLPLSIVFSTATLAAIKCGYLKPNPRFGVFPKVTLAVVVGYFIGKLSYQQTCAEKLMALPGSYIGQLLRDRRDGKISGTGAPPKGPSMFGAGPADIYSDAGPGSSLDLDTDRPTFSDDYRPDIESGVGPRAEPDVPPRAPLSYDELRRQNRGEYAGVRQDPYRVDPNQVPPISRGRTTPPPQSTEPPPAAPKTSTNKYGDVME